MSYRSAGSRQFTPYLMDSNTFNRCFVNCKMFFAFIANDIVILTIFACHPDYFIEWAYNKETFKNVSRYFAVFVPSKQHYSQTMDYGNEAAPPFLYHLKQHYSQTFRNVKNNIKKFLYHLKQHYSQTLLPLSQSRLVFLYHLKQHYSQTLRGTQT